MPQISLKSNTKAPLMECFAVNKIVFINENGEEFTPVQPCSQGIGHRGHVFYHAQKLENEPATEDTPATYYSGYHATIGWNAPREEFDDMGLEVEVLTPKIQINVP